MKILISFLVIMATFILVPKAQAKTLGVQSVSGAPGDVVTVALTIDDAKDLLSADITLIYDPGLLTLKEVKKATLTSDFIIAYNTWTGETSIAMATAQALQSGSGDVLEMSFQIASTVPVGTETNIQIARATLYSGAYQGMEKTLQGGKVTVRNPETVTTPATPSGPASGAIGTSYSYSTGGCTSSLGHTVEYQFDWKGDGSDLSSWGSSAQSKTWSAAATYNVRARARCSQNTSVVSGWSSILSVTVSAETVSTPNTPSGPTTGATGMNYSYSSGGSTSSLGHVVEYQFDWKGDGSDLSSWGSSAQSKTWSVAATYNVRARARCTTDTSVVSGWSSSLPVTISAETVSTPNSPGGPTTGTTGENSTYSTGGSTSNLGHSVEYQFDWKGDGSNPSAWGSSTQSKNWSVAGIYNVRARARCTTDTSVASNWSDSLSVGISVPDISVTPTGYDFGSVKVKRSKTASFVVKNNGTANLSISNSTVTGTDASMFPITSGSGSGSKTIKPGKTLTLKVAFKPTSAGSKSAILRITSNDPDAPKVDTPLGGRGQ